MGGLSFGAPLVLAGLLALPAIWWLLRLTPPRPQAEAFPPLRILQRVVRREETPSRSPWWLVLMRLLLTAAIILALAAPVLNPAAPRLSGGNGPLALMVDNGWASADDWDERRQVAAGLIREAEAAGRPVALVFTAGGAGEDATPTDAPRALERLAAARPLPVPVDRAGAARRLATALAGAPSADLALLSDGLDGPAGAEPFARLAELDPARTLVFAPTLADRMALVSVDNATEELTVSAVRPDGATAREATLRALDQQGREIARAQLTFGAGETEAQARFDIPVELRNDVARIERDGPRNAGEVRLLDESFQRRRVALVSGEASDLAQPLLSPLFYISRALEPFADLVRADSADLSVAIPRLVDTNPSVIVLADIGVLPAPARTSLEGFVDNGGTLVRFAGPRLAAAGGAADPLLPVRLRAGERQLGGALSWAQPQALAPIPATSPFAGIAIDPDITVSRQVLAEPSAELAERTFASLADGTPLVTGAPHGAGRIVLFHTTAEATWSNLPLSGAFVDMLRSIVTASRAGPGERTASEEAVTLPPLRVLDARGFLSSPGGEVQPLALEPETTPLVTPQNPPGLYGAPEAFTALNLFRAGDELRPIDLSALSGASTPQPYGAQEETDLAPWLFAAALVLLLVDALALFWLQGGLHRLRARPGAALVLAMALAGLLAIAPDPARAQLLDDTAALDAARAIEATSTTHLAFVETGDADLDAVSRQGLTGLSRFIGAKTALEPGEPMGVDIESDELAFYPLLYWPVDPASPMPSPAAISRIDAYMKNGGTVLFDVAEDAASVFGGVSAGQSRLRDILADLDIPPLEPVPADHVLTKAFYILNDFPGRHRGSQLWVEASANAGETAATRSSGDGVSSILITANDLAGAWAVDDSGMFVFPTDGADPAQREWAFRTGVNIVMYVLTGNYKADQVHVPALLERLGQ